MKRTVVVSGGGIGIGRAIARVFALSGDSVVIIGRRASILQKTAKELGAESGSAANGRVEAYPADLVEPDAVLNTSKAILSRHPVIDVLVNNAGGVDRQATHTLEEVADSWLRDFRSNVLTAVMLTEALLPSLRRPGGRIINMSSIAALRGGGGSYTAAKAAIIGWTFDLARSLGKEGITANAVAPGYVTGTEFFGNSMTPERHQRLVSETMDGKPGTPDDVAAAVQFLASEQGSHITGQIIQVNGGAVFGR
jgi:3-oxoacyl-[acyl-carrier protein] reductase